MSETEKTKEKTAKWHSMDGEAVVNKLNNLKYIWGVEIFYVQNRERFSRCYNF
jgi:hypothetical protein